MQLLLTKPLSPQSAGLVYMSDVRGIGALPFAQGNDLPCHLKLCCCPQVADPATRSKRFALQKHRLGTCEIRLCVPLLLCKEEMSQCITKRNLRFQ